MRKPILALLCLMMLIPLTSCTRGQQVENQAYVLIMGIDKNDSGDVILTVQTPKVTSAGESESSSAGGGGENYLQFSSEGKSFESALEKLEWIVPRQLNLSHLKLIVFSEELARDNDCRRLIYDVVHTERLFSAARAVVCAGSAKDFISNTKAVMGSRLSTDIISTFDHYVQQGFVPDSNLAELYYATESVYSDPVAVYAIAEGKTEPAAPASALAGDVHAVLRDTQSEIKTHYLGSALFSEGVCVGVLEGTQTMYLNLLNGSLDYFRYEHENQGLELFPAGSSKVHIDLQANPISIKVEICLNISAQEVVPDLQGLSEELENEILNVIRIAQEMSVEPFGFADAAAKNFATLKSWKAYRWQERFAEANVSVGVKLKHTAS